jgi:hypothetical protein
LVVEQAETGREGSKLLLLCTADGDEEEEEEEDMKSSSFLQKMTLKGVGNTHPHPPLSAIVGYTTNAFSLSPLSSSNNTGSSAL